MPTGDDRRHQDLGNEPNRRKDERRKTKKSFHLFRRSADPSKWLPGGISIAAGAFIVWSIVELNSVKDLRVSSIQHGVTISDLSNRVRMLETSVNSLLLNKMRPRSAYMSTSFEASRKQVIDLDGHALSHSPW